MSGVGVAIFEMEGRAYCVNYSWHCLHAEGTQLLKALADYHLVLGQTPSKTAGHGCL